MACYFLPTVPYWFPPQLPNSHPGWSMSKLLSQALLLCLCTELHSSSLRDYAFPSPGVLCLSPFAFGPAEPLGTIMLDSSARWSLAAGDC